jgi:hypothetical protein
MIPVPEKALEKRIEQLLEENKQLKAMKRISKFIEIAEENLKLAEENERLKKKYESL